MRVLGLDPGSRRTGYGLVEKSGNRLQLHRARRDAPAAPGSTSRSACTRSPPAPAS